MTTDASALTTWSTKFPHFCPFCLQQVKAAGSLYGCGLGGAFITTIGLVSSLKWYVHE